MIRFNKKTTFSRFTHSELISTYSNAIANKSHYKTEERPLESENATSIRTDAATSVSVRQRQRKEKRHYYYSVNERGQLYHLYDGLNGWPVRPSCKMPSGPSFMSDPSFLDHFFRHLRRAPSNLNLGHPSVAIRKVSSGETTSIAHASVPLFPSLMLSTNDESFSSDGNTVDKRRTWQLRAAGSLMTEFRPWLLRVREGRLYHPVSRAMCPYLGFSTQRRRQQHATETTAKHTDADDFSCPFTEELLLDSERDREYTFTSEPNKVAASDENVHRRVYGLLSSQIALELGLNCLEEVVESEEVACQPNAKNDQKTRHNALSSSTIAMVSRYVMCLGFMKGNDNNCCDKDFDMTTYPIPTLQSVEFLEHEDLL